jgi:nifR3 family TIM-barrel protein
MTNFWKNLKKPILCLAPMADVTDCVFRQIVAKYSNHGKSTRPGAKRVGGPDVFWTEFVSADGLCSKGGGKLLINLKYSKNEHPIVAQIFGAKIENIKKAAALCKKLGFDGIDINMGCPDKSVEKQGTGAALMRNPELAREIIRAAKKGGGNLPVSVKTRIGYNKNEIETWIPELLSENLAALIIHLRTRKEMSEVPAHWNLMKRIVEIRDEMKVKTKIIGNGNIKNISQGKKLVKETGCDGIMIGRGIFGNPWLFTDCQRLPLTLDSMSRTVLDRTPKEKLKVMVEHAKLFEKMLMRPAQGGSASGGKNFAVMKKHFKAYANGFNRAKELRIKLMRAENAKEVRRIVNDFLSKTC